MLALLCGGQGLISADMFNLAAEAPQAQPVFAAAAALLGEDPRLLVRGQGNAEAAGNRTSQLLSVTAALALCAALEPALPRGFVVTGYSVGEMAAWSIAGIWPYATALHLTAQRAAAMDRASQEPGRLAYVRGLGQEQVAQLAQAHECQIAIVSPGALFVVGGPERAIPGFCAQARAAGAARAEALDVHIAAHTSQLSAAIPEFEAALRQSGGQKILPGRQLLAGGNGERIFSPEPALHRLAAQVATPINWTMTLDSLCERGVSHVLDLGPGNALQRTAAGHLHGVACYGASNFQSLSGLQAWLAA